MIASTWFDLVVGVDVHFEMVPPSPSPLPFPHPFLGMVYDPAGMIVSGLVGAIVDLAHGQAPSPGKVLIWGLPATVTGDQVSNLITLPHFPLPPGVSWAPVPRAPMPKVGLRGKVPKPPVPVAPPGDALLLMGSKTVQLMGANPVRLGELALSCSDPVRLPTSTVLAVPKGPLVLIGGPSAVDWGQAIGLGVAAGAGRALKKLRSFGVASKLHRLVSRLAPKRLRNLFHKSVCFLTGHPVDVANGRVLTTMPGFSLPAPIPLIWEPEYASSWSDRQGALGWGWSHPFEQAVWTELGKVVYQTEDGREVEFSTMAEPEHHAWVGTTIYDSVNRLTLRSLQPRQGEHRWEIETHDGAVHEFRRIPGDPDTERAGLARIVATRTRDGHERRYDYENGRLARVHDGAGRTLHFQYNARGLLDRIHLPHPDRSSEWMLAARFEYSKEGDLLAAHDSVGGVTRYQYIEHLLTVETNRNGLSFRFAYDGGDSSARCIRTWGDGGIYDHEITYVPDSRMTMVEDSTGATTLYQMSPSGAVVKVVDPLGGETLHEYDDDLRKVLERDPLGNETRFTYDDRGNRTAVIDPLGASVAVQYDEFNNPVGLVDQNGSTWAWTYDRLGRRTREVDPQGHTTLFEYDERSRLLSAVAEPSAQRRTELKYDDHLNVELVRVNGRAEWRRRFDQLGRVIGETNPKGHVRSIRRDMAGRPIQISDANNLHTITYDAEGNVTRAADRSGLLTFEYKGFNWLHRRTEAGDPLATVRFEHDTEGRLIRVVNEVGEKYTYFRDSRGAVVEEVSFDGLKRRYRRDTAGRITETRSPSGKTTKFTRDPCGRVTRIERPEGTDTFRWRADGTLLEAANPVTTVRFERDVFGRVLAEHSGDHAVTSSYAPGRTHRHLLKSSLGLRVEVREDAQGDPVEMTISGRDVEPARISFVRDALGLEVERHIPGGVVARTERDSVGRPVRQTTVRDGQTLTSRAYEWQLDDRLASITDTTFGTARFEHDARRRLVAADYDGDRQYHTPDLVGNVFRSPDYSDRRYGIGGRLIELGGARIAHDDDGNVVRMPAETGRGELRLAYYSTGLLKHTTLPDGRVVTHDYDALGRRVSKTIGAAKTAYVWDGHRTLHEYEDIANPRTWVPAEDAFTPLAGLTAGGIEAIVPDHIDTPMAGITAAGEIAWQLQLDLFGVPRSEGQTQIRWPGQTSDSESGLYYNGARFYSPSAGRYTSPDPLGLGGGLSSFGYVANPLLWIDPWGLSCNDARSYGVSFFDQEIADIYRSPGAKLGRKGGLVWMMESGDAAGLRSHSDIVRATGNAARVVDAYSQQKRIYGLVFPLEAQTRRVPTTVDAGGWAHFLEGGHTAVRLPGPNGGYLLNSTKEFVMDGGASIPKGSVLFEAQADGSWSPVARF